jgi:hypothetical protein
VVGHHQRDVHRLVLETQSQDGRQKQLGLSVCVEERQKSSVRLERCKCERNFVFSSLGCDECLH